MRPIQICGQNKQVEFISNHKQTQFQKYGKNSTISTIADAFTDILLV